MKIHYVDTIKPEVLHRWAREMNDYAEEDNEDNEENDIEIEDEQTNHIPLPFKVSVARELFEDESEEVKAEVEKRREELATIVPILDAEKEEQNARVEMFRE